MRTAFQRDGAWFVNTHGYGNNVIPGMGFVNQNFGPIQFALLDLRLRNSLARYAAITVLKRSAILLLTACLTVGCNNVQEDRPAAQIPLRKLSIAVDASARSQFLSIIEDLAGRQHFLFRSAPVSPMGEYYIVEMEKPEFRVIVANDLDVGTFDVRIFENSVKPLPGAAADAFLAALVDALGHSEGIRVSEAPPKK